MKHANRLLVFTLTAAIRLARLLRARWPTLLVWTLIGVLAGGIFGATRPTLYRATAVVSLEPVVFNLSTVLSTGGLLRNYALELNSELYLGRAAARLGWPESPAELARRIRVVPDTESLTLTVEAYSSTPQRAVELANGLVRVFREDVEATNLQHEQADRLQVDVVMPAYGGVRVSPRWDVYVPAGSLGGFLVGLLTVGFSAWRRRSRICSPNEAEQVLEAPTLGLIPR